MSKESCATPRRLTPKELIEVVRGVLSAVRNGTGPIAVVVNNNQPGTQHIVETAQGVTLDVGTALYASPVSETAPCTKCGKTPPFPGGTRCQDLQCPFVQWSHTAVSATRPSIEAVLEQCAGICEQRACEWDSSVREGSEQRAYEETVLLEVAGRIRSLKGAL